MAFTAASRAEIRGHDETYLPKFILRLILTVFCLVSIGCIAWTVTTSSNLSFGYDELSLETVWTLIPLSLSVIWTLISLLLLISRKRPVHPGLNVAFDLILILMFVITGLGAIIGVAFNLGSIKFYGGSYNSDDNSYPTGANGTADIPSYATTAANGSTIYITPSNAHSCPRWNSCADEAAFNGFQYHRAVTALVGCVFLVLALILHLALFISACIDTHRRRRSARDARTAVLAEKIVNDMREQRRVDAAAEPFLEPFLMSGGQSSGIHDRPATVLGTTREQQEEVLGRLVGEGSIQSLGGTGIMWMRDPEGSVGLMEAVR